MQKIGKEIKIGLAVIGVLVVAFGYILFRRLTRPEDLAAAPPASTAPSAVAKAAGAPDKPTVVSATDTGRAADLADGASSSRSLFTSNRRAQASDSTDAGAEPRGSFMPAANNDATANNGVAASGGTPAAPENRFSQLGHHGDSPSSFKSGMAAGASGADAANDAASKSHNTVSADGNHSLFTSGNAAPPADPAAAPSATVVGAAPSDPFQQKSAVIDSPQERTSTAPSVAAAQSPGQMPADPSPPRQATLGDSNDGNPLRHSPDAVARPASAAVPDVVSSEVAAPHSGFGAQSTYTPAQTVPPPITSSAISVPSGQPTVAEPVSPAQPFAADTGAHGRGQYIVQPNDNYWTVSEKVYGTGGYFKAIYEHNRRQHSQSDRLQVGDALDVPDVAVLQQAYPDLCPKSGRDVESAPATPGTPAVAHTPPGTRPYSVAEGDTLYEIARRELGRASRWGEIYQLNHDQLGNDFGYLRPGTQLLIPSDGTAASVAREGAGALQR
jgi:nucleoid-associated protein YgaU